MQYNFKRPFPFLQRVKKAHRPLRLAIEDEVLTIDARPNIGELKVGDLAEIRVHKFRFNREQYSIAYQVLAAGNQCDQSHIDFLLVGTHENFYQQLKLYLPQTRIRGRLHEPRQEPNLYGRTPVRPDETHA